MPRDNLLDRKEASSCLKELLTKCNLGSDSFILVEPNPHDALSDGYRIRVKASLNSNCRDQVKTITKKRDLAVIEEENQIIIYRPKSNQIDTV